MSVACGKRNLLELREQHPTLFYPQTWWVGEAFMRELPSDDCYDIPPRRITHTGQIPKSNVALPSAVDFAHAFVGSPADAIWEHWIWTSNRDSQGQRVFVGVVNGRFEIHRHLSITERWGQAEWR